MATIKSYTDLQQSKKLAEVLPIESADMCYTLLYTGASLTGQSKYNDFPCVLPSFAHGSSAIPCWSLAALLGVLPKGTNISTPKPINELGYCCWNQYDEIYANNPIDACYEMIIKLNKLNLL